jgi:molybdopterin-containing oxidoreductase family iron-sulfur binding subunit
MIELPLLRDSTGLAQLRALAAGGQRQPWRSLEDLADADEFRELVAREFPSQLPRWDDRQSRRQFLSLMGASLGLAGLAGCIRQPPETIVPRVHYAEHPPSQALEFATTFTRGGYGLGVLATSREGRPIKIEGNPQHPASLGATDAFAQASLLDLYDPDRSQTILHRGTIQTWDRFLTALASESERLAGRQGAGLRILTETVTSPTLAAQHFALLEQLPEARWHQYQPAAMDQMRAGCRLAFGRDVEPNWRFDRAAVILSLGADFLSELPGSVRYARDFSERRRKATHGEGDVGRLYVLESTPTITGATADHRWPLRPSQFEAVARALRTLLAGPGGEPASTASEAAVPERWLQAAASDLRASAGRSLVIAGPSQPPTVQALAWAINDALSNLGQTVTFREPAIARSESQAESLQSLVNAMNAGEVDTLVILGGNPVYAAPAAVEFAAAMTGVKLRIHLAEYEDETSFLCDWHVPAAHYLESWSDARAYDGTASIVQPLVEPLYAGRTAHEIVSILRGERGRTSHEIVQEHWRRQLGPGDFSAAWRQALHDGIVAGTESPEVTAAFNPQALAERGSAGASGLGSNENDASSFEVEFRPDPTIDDGRFANNAWLQELPKPLSKITWDSAAFVSPADAERLQLASGDVVEIEAASRSLAAPVWIMPGQAVGCISLTLGYGRTRTGRVGQNIGYDTAILRPASGAASISGARLTKTTRRHALATTQNHHSLEGRDIVRVVRHGADHAAEAAGQRHHAAELPNFYPDFEYQGHAWGMVIDQTACIGCNACVVACQAENNIPVVGREQVLAGREMHWLRIDGYFAGPLDNPAAYFQPMMCVHCEQAPCEPVCPVAATVHDSEGTNNMIYNRCVGTRYCSNNCPYKVRRFNFLQYTDETTESLKLLRNPEVTVRSRGVMEKCTYCIQRISFARIEEKRSGQPLADGDVVTACQQVCPARAIVFGDLNDAGSAVRAMKASPLNYGVLAELNTRPRTTYLARITNPHPDLVAEEPQ